MIQRFYIHNFRCLENFELPLKGISSALLIGKNGSGKSTISYALEVLQGIGRGISRVGQLVKTSDFTRGNTDIPIRFEIEVILNEKLYKYVLVLELPENFKEPRISEEQLLVDGKQIYSRTEAQVALYKNSHNEASFFIDWHLVALPIIQKQSEKDPIHIFQSWLARIIILSPIPSKMKGDSSGSTLQPERDVSNFSEWFTGLLLRYPAAYSNIDKYIREIMPDFDSIENELLAKDARNISIKFKKDRAYFSIDFDMLSDGEKCFFLCAVFLAANKYYEPIFCFWDEPDNYLSLSEIEYFIRELRRSFKSSGQLLVTAHNAQAIERFSDENSFLLYRNSHLEPTLIKLIDDSTKPNDLITALICGDMTI